MPRPITQEMQYVIASGLIQCAFLVSMQFTDETVNVWTGFGPLSWNDIAWQGLGTILSIGVMEESGTPEARGITINLSGLDAAVIPQILEDYLLGGLFSVYFAAFDTSYAIIPDPILCWAGRMDKPTVKIDGKTAVLTIAAETRLVDMNIPINKRRSNDDQQTDVPGDLAFSFVAGLQEITLTFGQGLTTVTRNL